MSNRITFARFDSVLLELGFQQTVIPDSHVNYRRVPTEVPLMVQLHKPKDLVPVYVLAYVRPELASKCVIDPSAFEELLQNDAA